MTALPGKFARDVCALLAVLLMAFGTAVDAQTVAPAAVKAEVSAGVQRWIDENLLKVAAANTSPLRMEVSLGEIDRNLKLTPCEQVDPYLPVGNRLWGKTRLGLRCVQGVTKWNVFLPITVRAFGSAWVIRGNVAPGAVLSESDAMLAEVDWAELNSPIVASSVDWLGHISTRMLSTGQPLRQDMVKSAQVFQAGTQVRVLARGSGFEIATSAQAVSAGVVGESVRVRTDNGRTISGMVVDSRTVRLEL